MFYCVLCYRMGGIIPPVARDLHKKHIENIVESALKKAGMSVEVISLLIVKQLHQ